MKLSGKSEEGTVSTIVESMTELLEDATVPKNVREKIQGIVHTLNDGKTELSIRKDKALQILDGVSEDSNLQSYTRTQLWNVISMLEKI